MNAIAPSFLSPSSETEIVGFNIVAPDAPSQSRIVSFGQVFNEGQLSTNQGLQAKFGNIAETVQIDPKTFYADGSIQFAALTLLQPSLDLGGVAQGMLSTEALSNQSTVNIQSLLNTHTASVSVDFGAGGIVMQDLFSAVRAAIAAGSAEIWQSGPLISQVQVSIPFQDSLRLLTTVTAYADGTFSVEIGFNNDGAMSNQGGAKTYTARVSVDNSVALQTVQITQAQYQNWSSTVWGGGGQAPSTVIQHDPLYLERVGAIPTFDLQNGVSQTLISSYANQMAQQSWEQPLSNNNVERLMPTTGARPDIGITTEPTAVWLMTQDPIAERYTLGQADASGAVPWNFWNAQAGTWLNTDQYPNIWIDNRGGTSDSGSTGLTQQVSDQTGWNVDPSHQPDLSYYAYLMTGEKRYLDSLNAQAANSVTITWEAYRGPQQIVVGYDQVRASAWNLREIDEAAWANPVGSVEGKYFTKIADTNWKWLVAQIPSWTERQGEAYGQVEGYAWGSHSYSRPWMQDYFASVAAEAARHGNADALTFLKWESNFLVGRFLNGSNGFNPRDGVAYTLAMGPNANDGDVRYKTWAEIGQATVQGNESNGGGWGQSNGDYGALALVSLADIITVTQSTDAIKAFNYLITSGAPFTSLADLAKSNQLNIKPILSDKWTFAADGTIIQAAATMPGEIDPTSEPTGQSHTPEMVLPTVGLPRLASTSDSGVVGDGLTNVTKPTIVGVADIGSVVRLYDTDGVTLLGTATADYLGQYSVLSSQLSDGPHSLMVSVTNSAGDLSLSGSTVVIIDTLCPIVDMPVLSATSDSGLADDRITNVLTPTFVGEATAASAVTLYDTNGTTVLGTAVATVGGAYSIKSATLFEGMHLLTVRAVDAAGNVSLSSPAQAITIDTTSPIVSAPVLDGMAAGYLSVATTTVRGTAEANGCITVLDGAATVARALVDASGHWSTSVTLADGSHSIVAIDIDAAGNASTTSAVNVTVNTVPPVVLAVPAIITPISTTLIAYAPIISTPLDQADPTHKEVSTTMPPSPTLVLKTDDDAGMTFRFFDTAHGTQFMTSSPSERDSLIASRPDLTYEGVGMGTVQSDPNDANVASVFRFFSKVDGTHFFTTSAAEKDQIIATRFDFTFEGSSFNEHLTARVGDRAVYRFFDGNNGSHFFTTSDTERSSISATRPDMVDEGIAFYAPKI